MSALEPWDVAVLRRLGPSPATPADAPAPQVEEPGNVHVIRRPARTTPTAAEPGNWVLQRPPSMPEDSTGARSLLMLLPMLGAGASMTVMMLFRGSSMASLGALMMLGTVLASGVLVLGQRGRAARLRQHRRERYLHYLDQQRALLSADEAQLLRKARTTYPQPAALLSLTRSPERLWERRRDDVDVMRVRLGTGDVAARSFTRAGEQDPLELGDPFMEAELELVERRYSRLHGYPIALDLTATGNVSVVGDRAFAEQVSRILVAQVATLVSPEDAQLALVAALDRVDRWRWLQWLPHLADQSRPSNRGPVRRVAPDAPALQRLLAGGVQQRRVAAEERRRAFGTRPASARVPRLIVVADTLGSASAQLPLADQELPLADLGITVVHLLSDRLEEPDDVTIRISQGSQPDAALVETYGRRDAEPHRQVVLLDRMSRAQAEALARRLAGLRLSPDSLEHDPARQAAAATELMGVMDPEHVDLEVAWQPRSRADFLRVPVGTDDDGAPVWLDLKEAAHGGMGPHGLCVGATGSGKSELLRTLVLGLVSTHSPADVNLILVDYKGGAAFAPFAAAPHVAGVITNLNDDAALLDRVHASLAGEVHRRQQLLQEAGNAADIGAYRRLRRERLATGTELPALPHLLVVIDEFGELLTARPDLIELLLSIGRIGRSIGVHLLLSSQRIEAGRLRGLDTHLSYRIGLRTLSEAESRTVLDTPDAYGLPSLPGFAYLKVDTTTYTRFRAGYVSGPLREPVAVVPAEHESTRVVQLSPYAPIDLRPQRTAREAGDDEQAGPTVLNTVMRQVAQQPRVTPPVWMPPLPDAVTLDQAAGAPVATNGGLRLPRRRPLAIPIGVLDDPARQRQTVWHLDLDRAGGHVVIVGAPSSGRTTLLRTIAAATALTHDPGEAAVYALDLSGSGLLDLAALPHTGGVAVRMEAEVVRRTVEEITATLREREELCRQHGVETLAALRRSAGAAAEAAAAGVALADVLLLIDGYGHLNDEFDDLAEPVAALVRRGGTYGIHVIASVSRGNEIRLNLQTFFGTRIELRLGDPQDSLIASRLARLLTADRPGRCLLPQELFAQVALPRIDADVDRATLGHGFQELAARVAAMATQRAPEVRLLPKVVHADEVAAANGPGAVAIGLDESDLGTVTLDLNGRDPHVIVLGDHNTGRTSTLRHLALSLMERATPDALVFAVVDPRRTMRHQIPEPYLGGYAATSDAAAKLAAAVGQELRQRAEQAGGRNPQPRIVLLVDDYDVLTAGGVAPLQPLLPFLAMGQELGFAVVMARRTSGAARGIHEAVFAAVRDSGATGLMLSGDRMEGQLLGGIRPRRLPPGRALLIRSGGPARTVQLVWRRDPDGAR